MTNDIREALPTAAELRKALGSFVTGVTVVTAEDDAGRKVGVTANSFNSLSLDPPLVLWSIGQRSRSLPVFQAARRFAVNILSSSQVDTSRRFATQGQDKFSQTGHRASPLGNPILEGCVAHFDCSLWAMHEAGDHTLFIGQVQGFAYSDLQPLAYGAGRYMRLSPLDFTPAA